MKLRESELICDFTGFTMHATVGMILACTAQDARLPYMHPNRKDADGRADTSTGSVPKEVDIGYVITERE
jgi:hypothetical protein